MIFQYHEVVRLSSFTILAATQAEFILCSRRSIEGTWSPPSPKKGGIAGGGTCGVGGEGEQTAEKGGAAEARRVVQAERSEANVQAIRSQRDRFHAGERRIYQEYHGYYVA